MNMASYIHSHIEEGHAGVDMAQGDVGRVECPVVVQGHVQGDGRVMGVATAVQHIAQLHQRDVPVLPKKDLSFYTKYNL